MIKTNKKLNGRGFTLVEVLIAVLILVVVVGAAATVEVYYFKAGAISKTTIQAGDLAEQTAAKIKMMRDNNLSANPNVSPFTDCPTVPSGLCFADVYTYATGRSYRLNNQDNPVAFIYDINGYSTIIDGTTYTIKTYFAPAPSGQSVDKEINIYFIVSWQNAGMGINRTANYYFTVWNLQGQT